MLVVTIVDRMKSAQVLRFFRSKNVKLLFSCFGEGTATSAIRDILGISEKEKSIILGLMPNSWLPVLITQLSDEMKLRNPGNGILFTIPISAANKGVPARYTPETEQNSEVRVMYEASDRKYEMVLLCAESGNVDFIMDAARAAGARGGTVIDARAAADDSTESFFGLKIHDKTEIIAIVVEREEKLKIMNAVSAVLAEKCPSSGIVFSLPVNDFVGIGTSTPKN